MIQNKNLFMVLFPCTYMYKGGQVKKFGHFEGSSQFHRYWQIFTLIKYSSSLCVKNVRSVLRIWGNAPLN